MSDSSCCSSRLELAFANLLLRLWIGLRLFMAGIDKFRWGSGEETTFSFENYEKKVGLIADLTADNGFIPKALCGPYASSVGYLLLIGGIWAVLGICSRIGLLFCGFVFLSLGFGLATLPDDTEVVLIGVQVLIVAAALATNDHNKFSIDGLFGGKKKAPAAPEGEA